MGFAFAFGRYISPAADPCDCDLESKKEEKKILSPIRPTDEAVRGLSRARLITDASPIGQPGVWIIARFFQNNLAVISTGALMGGWLWLATPADKSQQAWGAGDFGRSRWLKWTRGLLSYVVMVFRWMAMVVCAQCLRSAS
uniref:Uncharacterized protein n=1 Tax=Oryza barthii TaxID=65489 RepID=A0A0D3EXK4_9ORYZ